MKGLRLLILLLAQPAFADDQLADAEAMMARGEKLMAQQKYKEAIAVFSAARALAPGKPGPLLWLGLAYSAADNCKEALPALEEYVKLKKDDSKPEASRALAACKAVLASQQKPAASDPMKDLAAIMVGDWTEEGRRFAGWAGPTSPEVAYTGEISCGEKEAAIVCHGKLKLGAQTIVTRSRAHWDAGASGYRMTFTEGNKTFGYLATLQGKQVVGTHRSPDGMRARFSWDLTDPELATSRVDISLNNAPFTPYEQSTLKRQATTR